MTKIVEIWAKGYADETGLTVLRLEDDVNIVDHVRKTFGSFARVSSVRIANPRKVAPVSEEYARMMSRNDNS